MERGSLMSDEVDLVTGAFGFAGSHVVLELLGQGRRVLGMDLAPTLADPGRRKLMERLGLDLEHPNLELVAADLLHPGSLQPLLARRIGRIFHTASLYDYSASLSRLRQVNIEGTRNLLAVAIPARVERFIHWSTCGVFGKPYPASYGVRSNLPFSEESSSPRNTPEDALQPEGTHLVNVYSVSKWEQEKLVWKAHRESGLPVTVIRPAPIYGPGSDYGHGGIILAVAAGLVPVIPADSRNFVTTSVHVLDLARFACWIAEQPGAIGEDYNVVDNSIISYHEFLHYIALLVGRRMWDIPLVFLPLLRPVAVAAARLWTTLERRYGLPKVRVFEVQSATYLGSSYWVSNRKTLRAGFEYRYPDVREGLKDTIVWMRDAGWLGGSVTSPKFKTPA